MLLQWWLQAAAGFVLIQLSAGVGHGSGRNRRMRDDVHETELTRMDSHSSGPSIIIFEGESGHISEEAQHELVNALPAHIREIAPASRHAPSRQEWRRGLGRIASQLGRAVSGGGRMALNACHRIDLEKVAELTKILFGTVCLLCIGLFGCYVVISAVQWFGALLIFDPTAQQQVVEFIQALMDHGSPQQLDFGHATGTDVIEGDHAYYWVVLGPNLATIRSRRWWHHQFNAQTGTWPLHGHPKNLLASVYPNQVYMGKLIGEMDRRHYLSPAQSGLAQTDAPSQVHVHHHPNAQSDGQPDGQPDAASSARPDAESNGQPDAKSDRHLLQAPALRGGNGIRSFFSSSDYGNSAPGGMNPSKMRMGRANSAPIGSNPLESRLGRSGSQPQLSS